MASADNSDNAQAERAKERRKRQKKLKILVAFDYPLEPPKDGNYAAQLHADDWRPIRNVTEAISRLGHEVILQGVYDNIMPLIYTIKRRKPDLAFNLLESFKQQRKYEGALAGLFDLLQVPYTGPDASPLMQRPLHHPHAGLARHHEQSVRAAQLSYDGVEDGAAVQPANVATMTPLKSDRNPDRSSIGANPPCVVHRRCRADEELPREIDRDGRAILPSRNAPSVTILAGSSRAPPHSPFDGRRRPDIHRRALPRARG
ncbi:MAG TPA: hypothetical protein PKC74_05145, partial [Turneriella sp.]|nr:hypothetical protein [Turneriella sp.]